MNCYICKAPTDHYFRKRFDRFGLDSVNYRRCIACGTVYAETLLQLPEERWRGVCEDYHNSYRGSGENPDDPNWRVRLNQQAELLLRLAENGLLNRAGPWLDHGCGEGELAAMLAERIGKISCYDRYWKGDGYLQEAELIPRHYSLVISTSTLEHLRSRSSLDAITGLIAEDGSLALHTLVRGEIPRDPAWFYLLPVHTIFYTNKGMAKLFDQWGFHSSIYAVDARLWIGYRKPLAEVLKQKPQMLASPGLHASEGFLAYWP
ncbi:MAG: methyltransferase domain-containing protein [Candidatus Thiodiazotropha sp.]|nr:class I SAM-dependent methyltransferase [Candidatus Thiodiazotropha taylori]